MTSDGTNLHTASSVSLNIHNNTDQGSPEQSQAKTTLPGKDIRRPTKSLPFACVNARSVRNKIAVIVEHMVNGCIDISTFTETWLKECDSVSVAGLKHGRHTNKVPGKICTAYYQRTPLDPVLSMDLHTAVW